MNGNVDAFVEKLQEKIFDETREAFGEEGFQRWRRPLYRGPMIEADSHARVTGQCGDTMEIFLKFNNDRVSDAAYLTNGCGSSTVCGSFAAEMALDKLPDELMEISGETILERIGRFPEDDRHCASLAAETLQEALNQYMLAQRNKKVETSDYRYLFGPVPSRRFGRSLGIDLTPHKTCSLDCVFCQLGRTPAKTLERKAYVPATEVISEIDHWLRNDGQADYLTLSGSGEPTLHTAFGQVLAFLRDQPIPSALLTNGTLMNLPEVRKAAALARVVKVSLSAWDQKSFEWVNRPHHRLSFESFFDGLKRFRDEFSGQLWLEVFLLSDINATPGNVAKIARLSRNLQPDRIHLNTIARPPAEDFAAAVSMAKLEELVGLFDPPACIAAEFKGERSKRIKANEETILAMLKRRPCTIKQIETAFGLHINEASKFLGHLKQRNRIRIYLKDQKVYYRSI